jgi:hypothetical protein
MEFFADRPRIAALVREGAEYPQKTAQAADYEAAVRAIAEKVKQDVLQAYGGLSGDPNEDANDSRSDVNNDLRNWVEEDVIQSEFPKHAPLEVLKNSVNANAFQDASPDWSDLTWDGILFEMALAAMRADVFDALRGLGWDEDLGFSHEVK